MKTDYDYMLLVGFVAFILIKELISLVVEVKFPTYKHLDRATESWKLVVKIRSAMNFITICAISYFLYIYKLAYAPRLIFKILLVRSILYFMIDDQYIWLFIDKTHERRTLVHDLNTYGDSVALFLVALVAVYSLTTIFAPK
jgi:hypothetical protein